MNKVKELGHIKIDVKGAIKPLMASTNCSCGGKKGVAFRFGNEGGWLIPWEDLENLVRSKKP